MFISTKGRYALRLMLDLAENHADEQAIPLKKIAERQAISVKYLEQIITSLSKAGLVRSIRGSQGGYKLAMPADKCTVGMILRTTEGTLAPVSCLEDEINECGRSAYCPTLFVWEKLYKAISETVDSITLADIIKNEREHSGGSDYII